MNRKQLGIAIAKAAGNILLSYFGKPSDLIEKGDKDFVLEADLKAEDYIVAEILQNFPNDSILSEEKGELANDSEFRWIIDPLDGTANFKASIPYFCASIGLEFKNKLIMAFVYNPITSNFFFAEKNNGAFLNNAKIKVSSTNQIEKFFFSYSTSHHQTQDTIRLGSSSFEKILNNCRAIRLRGSSILDLCNLANGTFDALIKVGASYWDFAPGCLIVEEAGGIVTDLGSHSWDSKTQNFLASNNQQHAEILKILTFVS